MADIGSDTPGKPDAEGKIGVHVKQFGERVLRVFEGEVETLRREGLFLGFAKEEVSAPKEAVHQDQAAGSVHGQSEASGEVTASVRPAGAGGEEGQVQPTDAPAS